MTELEILREFWEEFSNAHKSETGLGDFEARVMSAYYIAQRKLKLQRKPRNWLSWLRWWWSN